MWSNQSDEVRRARLMKKRQDRAASWFGVLTSIPVMYIYFTQYRLAFPQWLTKIGILPDYGISQFMQGPSIVDYDRVLASGFVGALAMVPGYLIAKPFVRKLVR